MVATLTAPMPVRNKVGRPRAFQDEDVYRVMVSVVSHVGYSGLTFALIAAQIHCTTSALIRRFGDKQALVNGFIGWLSTGPNEEATAHLASLEPLERIEERWMMPRTNAKNVGPELFLAFFIEARSDPAYRARLGDLGTRFERAIIGDLDDAVGRGLLKATNTTELGHTLVCALVGCVSLWLDNQRGSLGSAVHRTLSSLLAPYRP